MKNLFRNRNFYIVVLIDATLITIAYLSSYWLRFDAQIPEAEWFNIRKTLPYIILIKLFCFFFFDLYKGMWRYTSLIDLKNLIKAVTASSILIVAALLIESYFRGYPRSVFVIDWSLTFLLVGGSRMAIRLLMANNSHFSAKNGGAVRNKKLIIIGAGNAGEKVVRELLENPEMRFEPMGFLDDDVRKLGKSIHGISVLGTVDKVRDLDDFEEILIAIPSATGQQMRRIVDLCEKTGKRFRTVPGIGELIEGRVSVKAIREVNMEDLLGREEVRLNQKEISDFLHRKRVLITGAGGSIGSELVRQVIRFNPEAIALVDFSELNIFQIENECRERFRFQRVSACLVDIRNKPSLERVFNNFGPQIVFHAAAYKHVPIQEFHPWEAVLNNVLGTRNLVELSVQKEVDHFVLVSTDKAVRPCNIMGASKRVAELLMESVNGQAKTRFITVRFGNVISSSGSVIPIFQEQIARGGPVTVTHPEITRYFMSIPEAAQLILQAGAMGQGGETFILEMGKPVKIRELVEDLIRLHGLEPEKDIPIEYIGLRPGEKLYEELITEGEGIVPTDHQKILVLRGHSQEKEKIEKDILELIALAGTYDAFAIKTKLKEIVSEYTPQN